MQFMKLSAFNILIKHVLHQNTFCTDNWLYIYFRILKCYFLRKNIAKSVWKLSTDSNHLNLNFKYIRKKQVNIRHRRGK